MAVVGSCCSLPAKSLSKALAMCVSNNICPCLILCVCPDCLLHGLCSNTPGLDAIPYAIPYVCCVFLSFLVCVCVCVGLCDRCQSVWMYVYVSYWGGVLVFWAELLWFFWSVGSHGGCVTLLQAVFKTGGGPGYRTALYHGTLLQPEAAWSTGLVDYI